MQSRDQTPLKDQPTHIVLDCLFWSKQEQNVKKTDDEHQKKYRHVQDKHLQQIQSKKQTPVKKGPAKGE